MKNLTSVVLHTAFERARTYRLPVLMTSTTGKTAKAMLDIVKDAPVRLIVLTHDPRRVGPQTAFDLEVRQRLLAGGHTFLEDEAPWLPSITISRLLEMAFNLSSLTPQQRLWTRKYGIGGKVCFLMTHKVIKAGLLRTGESCVCLGGSRSGCDTALQMRVSCRGNRLFPEVESVLVSA
ncbi:MAG: hypothetical protein WC352_04980, partial [Candidatus Omnitrophota bacterium]